MSQHPAPYIPFTIALFAAPVLLGDALLSLTALGEYASRFSSAGGGGLLMSIPAWFLVFWVLARRAALQGRHETRDHVFISLYANLATLVIYPAVLLIAELAGADITGFLAANMDGEDPPTALMAGFVVGGAGFFLGLFFMPILAVIFSKIARKLGAFG